MLVYFVTQWRIRWLNTNVWVGGRGRRLWDSCVGCHFSSQGAGRVPLLLEQLQGPDDAAASQPADCWWSSSAKGMRYKIKDIKQDQWLFLALLLFFWPVSFIKLLTFFFFFDQPNVYFHSCQTSLWVCVVCDLCVKQACIHCDSLPGCPWMWNIVTISSFNTWGGNSVSRGLYLHEM